VRWIGRELDGHGLLTWDGDGERVGAEALGAYGETLAYVARMDGNESLAMNAFHGMEEDDDLGMTGMGVRHVLPDGRWMQPEPLLALGVGPEAIDRPAVLTGNHGSSNPVVFSDLSGSLLTDLKDLAPILRLYIQRGRVTTERVRSSATRFR